MKPSKMYLFSNFKGIDTSSSPLDVKSYNATYSRNFITDDGVLRKRRGSKEVDRYDGRINGFYSITIDGELHTIVHCGKKIYCTNSKGTHIDLSLRNGGNELQPCALESSKIIPEYILDKRSFAVEQKNRLYIACGDYLVYGKWGNGKCELRRVYNNFDFDDKWNNTGTYIPTTTISIDNVMKGASDIEVLQLDDVNLLTPYRKNGLVGLSGAEGDELKYYLDAGNIKAGTEVKIIANVVGEASVDTKYYLCAKDSSELKDSNNVVVGSIDRAVGRITFNSAQPPVYPDDSNITVIYCPAYDDDSVNSSKITECNIGGLFGLAGNCDQLFLTGGASNPNMDHYSDPMNFSYFPDSNYTVVGSRSCGIAGYSRIGDGSMAIHKFSNSGDEASIYFRTPKEEPVMYDIRDASGIIVGEKQLGIKIIYPIKAGSAGIGLASSYANASFVGDNLVLCEGGVFGITLTQNTSVAERIARARSANIATALKKHNLSEAVACVFQGRYYLSVDGKCYVADATIKSQDKTAAAMDTFNYEWWVFDNVNARVWIQKGDTLLYGDNQGRVVEMFTNGFLDTTYEKLCDVGIDFDNNRLSVATNISIEQLNKIEIMGEDIYQRSIADISKLPGNYLTSESKYRSGWVVYADNVGSSGLVKDRAYIVSIEYTDDGKCFTLVDGVVTAVISGPMDGVVLCRKLNNRELYISSIDEASIGGEVVKYIKLSENLAEASARESITLHNYSGVPGIKSVRLISDAAVKAEWRTGITDLGAPYMAKSLTDLYITPDATGGGLIKFGYKTYNSSRSVIAQGTSLFNFNAINFNAFTFSALDFPQGYRESIMDRDRNYVQMSIISDTDSDASISNMAIKYMINREIKGVE